jgi:hypothetical protein
MTLVDLGIWESEQVSRRTSGPHSGPHWSAFVFLNADHHK